MLWADPIREEWESGPKLEVWWCCCCYWALLAAIVCPVAYCDEIFPLVALDFFYPETRGGDYLSSLSSSNPRSTFLYLC